MSTATAKDQSPPRFYNDIVCIGAGLSGIAVGAWAKILYNFTDIHFYERQAEVGGTWWINTYPGVACDVPSALYSFSFEQNPEWTCMMPPGPEIKAYADRVAEKYDIPARTSFKTEAVRAEWREDTKRWIVYVRDLVTAEEYTHECKVVFSCMGQLGIPNYADLPGSDKFEGSMFHSARWDHSVSLVGKKIAVIGNGCTAAQIVPGIVDDAAEVHQFIRSKHWIQKPASLNYTPVIRWVFKNVPFAPWLHRFTIFLGAEWGYRLQKMNAFAVAQRKIKAKEVAAYMREMAPKKYHDLLIPDFEIACKRRIMDTGYLTSLHNPKVNLTSARVVSILPNGIRTTEGDYPVDMIVHATGFKTNLFCHPVEVVGRNGETIQAHWKKLGGPGSYNCSVNSGFPNLFIVLGPNAATGHTSALMASENTINYALNVLEPVLRGTATSVELKQHAEEAYIRRIQTALKDTVWTGCNSWYKTKEGWNAMSYPWSQAHFLYRSKFITWGDWDIAYIRERSEVKKWALMLGVLLAVLGVALTRAPGGDVELYLKQLSKGNWQGSVAALRAQAMLLVGAVWNR